MKRYFLYAIFSCLLCFTSIAQTNFLQITNAYFTDTAGIPITNLTQSQIVRYNITIRNLAQLGVIAFNDSLALQCQINPNNTFTLYLSNPTVVINPQDTVNLQFIDTITNARYGGGGGGTIVIWPITNNVMFATKDSFLLPYIYVSIENVFEGKASWWNIYPNPAQKELYIKNLEAKNQIEYVRIFSSTGVLIKEKRNNCTEIDVSDLGEGIYFLLIYDKAGKQGIYKVEVGKKE